MKATPKPAVNDCPKGNKHSFIFGSCMNCGLSIRYYKARVKEARLARSRVAEASKRSKRLAARKQTARLDMSYDT